LGAKEGSNALLVVLFLFKEFTVLLDCFSKKVVFKLIVLAFFSFLSSVWGTWIYGVFLVKRGKSIWGLGRL